MASPSRFILSEQCKAEFEVLDAIYGQELSHTSENQLKVRNTELKSSFMPNCLELALIELAMYVF